MALSNKNGQKAQEIQSAMKKEVVDCLLKTKVLFILAFVFFLACLQNIFKFIISIINEQVTAATVIEDLKGDALLVIGSIHGIFLWDFTKNVIVTGAPLSCLLRQIEATSCNK